MTRAIDGRAPTSFSALRTMLDTSAEQSYGIAQINTPTPTRTPECLVLILQHQGRTIRAEFHPDNPWQLSVSAGPVMLQEVTLPDGTLVEALLAVQRAYTILRNVSEDNIATHP